MNVKIDMDMDLDVDMDKDIEIVKDYRDNKALRDSFNELAEKIFDLNFEAWYQNGFWKENYNPYSIVVDGKIVANVSVNQCNTNYNGIVLRLIQLGTVMTDPKYRGKGYSRILMEAIMKEYEGKVDGIYLYANDSVLDFYPRFGFTKRDEYQYVKQIEISTERTVENVSMESAEDWAKMIDIMKSKPQLGNMTMTGNEGLYMFYLSQFMNETVYYMSDLDTYVVAEVEEDTLLLYAAWGEASIEDVYTAFGSEVKKVVLLFTPSDTLGYEELMVDEEDTTFFTRGAAFEPLKDYKFMLQAISHA